MALDLEYLEEAVVEAAAATEWYATRSTTAVAGFETEMREGKVDWQLVAYGGAVHSFTHWEAGSDNSKGAAYNEKADRRSWEAMKSFFAEIFH